MSRAWGDSFGDSWGDSWGEADPATVTVDGGLRQAKRRAKRIEPRPVRPLDSYRTPEDIRREQLETERYLASLEKSQQVPAKVTSGDSLEQPAPTSGRRSKRRRT
jgi:hypothetical protein